MFIACNSLQRQFCNSEICYTPCLMDTTMCNIAHKVLFYNEKPFLLYIITNRVA